MEYYLSHELVLIVCGKRTDSVQPEKNSISRKRKQQHCTPFSCLGGPNGPTERPDRTGTNSRLFDVDGHHRRWMWTPIFLQKIPMCRFGWRGPGFCMDPYTFVSVGTERMTTKSLVPFHSFPCSLVGINRRSYPSHLPVFTGSPAIEQAATARQSNRPSLYSAAPSTTVAAHVSPPAFPPLPLPPLSVLASHGVCTCMCTCVKLHSMYTYYIYKSKRSDPATTPA